MGKYKGFHGAGMNTNKNVSSVVKQAQKMQEEMEKIQTEVEGKIVEASSGGGAVVVTANGKKEILSVKIQPEAVDSDDVETLEDLVMSAVNEVIKKVEKLMEESMSQITGGINIPGLF